MGSGRIKDGLRILVVEDEMSIVMMIEDALIEMGAEIVGPTAWLDAALQLAREATIDLALLDINIQGGASYPVADILVERGIPFVLCSGYGDWAIEERHRDRPRLAKPFTEGELSDRVIELLGAQPG